jgi:hypothetical protein
MVMHYMNRRHIAAARECLQWVVICRMPTVPDYLRWMAASEEPIGQQAANCGHRRP